MTLLSMTRGDTGVFQVTLTDSAGDPLVLTDRELTFTVKRRLSDSDDDALIQKTVGEGIVVSEDEPGVATITIDPVDTSGIANGPSLYWDIQVQADDDVRTPLSGRLIVIPDATRTIA